MTIEQFECTDAMMNRLRARVATRAKREKCAGSAGIILIVSAALWAAILWPIVTLLPW